MKKLIEDREGRIKMLETASTAADMVENRQTSKIGVATPSLEEYQNLKRDFDELSRKFEEIKGDSNWKLKMSLQTLITTFSIDDYGNVTAAYPWLTRLIDLNRTKAVIIKRLMEKGDSTAAQIALEYGFNADTIRGHLNELLKRGVVTESSTIPHRYSLRKV